MRILHICPKLGSGGMEKLLKQWYIYSDGTDIEYEYIVYEKGGLSYDFFIEKGCKIHLFEPLRKVGLVKFYNQFNQFFVNNKFDIIHAISGVNTFIIFICAALNGVKHRFNHAHTNKYEDDNKAGFHRLLINITKKLSVLFSTELLSCSKEAAIYCFSKKIAERGKVTLILNGIDIDKFRFDEKKRNDTRKKLQVDNKLVIGTIGRLSYQKNFEFLIEVFYEINKKRSDSVLIIVGEGDYKERLIKKASDLDIINDIMFLGTTDDVSPALMCMDIFILPSLFEGLGLVAIEAQTSGLHCFLSTFVPSEAKITDRVTYLKLEDGAKYWASTILEDFSLERYDESHKIYEAGYSSKESSLQLIELYLKCKKNN